MQDLVQIRDEVIDEHKELRAAGQMIPQAEQTMLAELDTQITSMQGDIAEEQAAKELPKRARAAIRAGESAARLEERADWEEKLLEERAQAREAIADQRIDIAEAQKLVDAYIVQHLPPKQRDAAFKKIKALAKYAQPETRQKYVDKALEAIDEMEAEQERDLARNKLKADINKWTAELKKAQGKGKHSKLAETHAIRMAEYLDAITAVSLKKAATMRQAVEYFSDSGSEDYGDALGKKMADAMRPNINQMTREQLEQARADLNFIAKEGMLKGELQAVQRKRGLAREASLAAEVINKTSGVEKLGPLKRSLKRGRDKNRLLEAQREFFKRHSWSWMDPQRALWFMEGYDPSRPLHRAVWGRAAAAKDKKILATRAAVKSLQDDIIGDFNVTRAIKNDKDYAIEFTERQPDGTSKAASEPMTVEQMMFVYLHSKNPKQRAHLQATGWSDEMIDDVIANLPPEAKKVVQSIWVYTKGRQPAVSEVFAREHNVPMHAENSYFPIADLELRKGNELTPRNAIMYDAISRASVKKGFASQRSGDKSPFGRMEVFSTLARHIRDTEQYIAWNDATREINEILNDPALRQAMNDRNRAVAGDIREWMQLLAKGKTRRAESPVDKLSEWLRTNIAVSTIGMNIASVMKAPVSFFAGAQRLDNRFEAVHSLMRLLTHPKKTYGFVMDSSPPMSERSQNSERELSEIFEKSETGRWLKKNNPSQVYAEIKIAAMGLWRVADMVTTTSLWDARYREEIGKGKDHDAAVRAANELIETTQPMGGIMYLSPLRRGPGLARGLTWFTGQQSQNLNLVSETFNNWRGFKSAAGDSIWFVIIPAMLIFMASHGGRMPKTKKEWAVSMLDQVFGGLPIVREMIRGAASMLFGSGPEDRYNTEVMPVPLAPFEAIAKALPRKDWEKIVVELARIAGVPGVIQARRTYKGIKRFRETGDPRFLIWSPYALGKGGKKKKAKKIKPRG